MTDSNFIDQIRERLAGRTAPIDRKVPHGRDRGRRPSELTGPLDSSTDPASMFDEDDTLDDAARRFITAVRRKRRESSDARGTVDGAGVDSSPRTTTTNLRRGRGHRQKTRRQSRDW